ncbi:uncharacterized protein LOC117109772 [Anneissia japonica]|uniref:uncharacterized protein LOC117109772 n=1 Tax=Anneissia japonica TaxID=1529436 RepID=UPI0014259300|nr:uncharacterized protein LOC117109772 [Anneissia japonica]
MFKEYSDVSGMAKSYRFDNSLLLRRQDSSIISKAYSTLKSHKKPLALPGIPRSSRHISYYDYLPHRKVWSEKDQREKDRSRRMFRKEVQKELERQLANEEARDRDMFPKEDEVDTATDDGESYLEQYFPSIRNTRRTSAQSSASTGNGRRLSIQSLHAFFPEIDNYDFAPLANRPSVEKDLNTAVNFVNSEDPQGDDGLLSDNSKIGTKPGDSAGLHLPRNEKRVSFALTDKTMKLSTTQRRDSENPHEEELTEMHRIKKPNNTSNSSKHDSRLNLLHGSIEETMEASRQLNESRIRQRRNKSKSAVTLKREINYFPKRANSAYVQGINPVYTSSANEFAQSISYASSQAHNVVITAPHINTMGVKRR